MISQSVLLAISTWATVALAFIAGTAAVWGYIQVRVMRNAKEWQEAQAIMGELRSTERIAQLNNLYRMEREPLKLAQKEADFRIFISRMDWVGIMVRRKLISTKLVMELIPAMPSRLWYVLGLYVEAQAKHRGRYGPDFRRLVEYTLVYFVANSSRKTWPRLGPPARTEGVDLVPFLAHEMRMISSFRFRRAVIVRRFKATFRRRLRMTKRQWEELARPVVTGRHDSASQCSESDGGGSRRA